MRAVNSGSAALIRGWNSPNIGVWFKYRLYTTVILRPKYDLLICTTNVIQSYYTCLDYSIMCYNRHRRFCVQIVVRFKYFLDVCAARAEASAMIVVI
jgi:hypothetical protein